MRMRLEAMREPLTPRFFTLGTVRSWEDGESVPPRDNSHRAGSTVDARKAITAEDAKGPKRSESAAPIVGDEAGLVEKLVARDEAAFGTLVRAYERRVFRLLARMIGNRAEAEDLAQEVFVQVFKAIGSFRGESKLSTWIYRIAVNLSKNRSKYLRVRHTGQQEDLEKLDQRTPAADAHGVNTSAIERPDELAAGRQLERIVQAAILEIEPSFRECLVLRDVEDLSYAEIGAITGLPEGTVKSRLHRARAQLKELVECALGEKIQ